MQKTVRIRSIDIMRGLTLFLMLFVNDLFSPGVPGWLVHTKADFDGMGLADWVFPGFLFIVGMAVPHAINYRFQSGQSKIEIFGHILLRSVSLLIIGLFMMNSGRLNPELSGINKSLWAVLMYISVFLIWNNYSANEKLKKLFLTFRLAGISGLILLAVIFKAGEPGNILWFETGWWGILGLIGWGYLVAATVHLFIGSKLLYTFLFWMLFTVLNILSNLGHLELPGLLGTIAGVILNGNVPSTVMAGLFVSLFLKQSTFKPIIKAGYIVIAGIACITLGFFLRNWFIISKIQGTPSWVMICSGISMIVFSGLFLMADIGGMDKWASIFKPAGRNSLTTYLAPDVIYYLIWGLGLPLFFYKQENSQALAVGGSVIWSFAMIGFAALLEKISIRLKL